MGGKGTGKEKPGGQPELSLTEKRGIRVRLNQVRRRDLRHLDDQEFADAIGASTQAVKTWLDKRAKPVTPNTYYMVRIAEKAHVQLRWLLQGLGPEKPGEAVTLTDLEARLREHIANVLAHELGARLEFVTAALRPADVLQAAVDAQWHTVAEKIDRAQRLDRVKAAFRGKRQPGQRLLDIAIEMIDLGDTGELEALGPVDPPGIRRHDSSPLVPLVPPLTPGRG